MAYETTAELRSRSVAGRPFATASSPPRTASNGRRGGLLNGAASRLLHPPGARAASGLLDHVRFRPRLRRPRPRQTPVSLWDERATSAKLRELADARPRARHAHHGAGEPSRSPASGRPRSTPCCRHPRRPTGADKLAYGKACRTCSRRTDIAGIVRDFAAAAARLERCGFDGIEITALGTHLIEQFWSPALNRREDGYGGSPENRLRFALEVLRAVDEATSPDFLIAFRMSVDPQTDLLGLTTADLLDIALAIERTGLVDLFDLSGGSGANTATHSGVVPTDTFPVMPYADLSRRWKQRIAYARPDGRARPAPRSWRGGPDLGRLRPGGDDARDDRGPGRGGEGGGRARGPHPPLHRHQRGLPARDPGPFARLLGEPRGRAVRPGDLRAHEGAGPAASSSSGRVPAGWRRRASRPERGFDVTVLERSDRIGAPDDRLRGDDGCAAPAGPRPPGWSESFAGWG